LARKSWKACSGAVVSRWLVDVRYCALEPRRAKSCSWALAARSPC